MIKKIFDDWLQKYPELKNEEYVTLLAEGIGSYKGKPNKYGTELHKLGRMGAELAIFKNGELIFSTKNASTLPDIPMDTLGRFNSGLPTPTPCVGMYPLYTKLHGKKRVPAFELGRGWESIPVIRNSIKFIEYKSNSNAINLHYRSLNDNNTFACSTGCQTALKEEFDKILKILGCWTNGKYIEGQYVGKLIIDRSQITLSLQKRYQKLYGKYYEDCFNIKKYTILKPKEIVSSYARKAWEKFKRIGVNDGVGAKNNVTEEQLMVFQDRHEEYMVNTYGLKKVKPEER
ncbi:hypothetical protein [Vallitalea guaymasensis]|uniref:hypothetical protein n=1 Tax=Vallitalea guaymasensis TaxID=1185412 RepID=UPI000DE3A881|nr:hypothetical protein [Vallitalea guaymasensis]